MFMNDPDFDDEFQPSPGFEYGHAFPSPDSKQKQERKDIFSISSLALNLIVLFALQR